MLCRRLNKIICTQSPIHNSSQHRNPTIVRSKCSWINNLVAALNTDPMSSYRLRLILRDLNVTRLWNAWFRMQLVSSMVKRCRRDRGVRDMLACFKQTILRPSRTFLLSATAAYNSNPSDGTPPCSRDITDAELEELTRAFDGVDELSRTTLFCQGCSHRLVIDKQHPGVKYCTCPDAQPPGPSADGWEPYMEADDVIIWRKEYKPGGLYAYKVYGRYKDLRASTFATIQVDGAYRRSWDDAVAALSLVEREANGVRAQSVLHWEVAWPRFFSNRDYVYIRRHAAFAARTRCLPHVEAIFSPDEPDPCAAERPSVHTPAKRRGMRDERRERAAGGAEGALNKVYVIISRSCTHPAVPAARSPIRVTEYWSDMVVRSIDGADKPGMEFVLTYYDEPAVGGLPSGVSAWATGRAAPSYLARMHAAARAYEAWSAAHTEEPDFEPFDVVAPTAPAAPAAPTAPAAPAVAPEAAKKPLLETPAVEVQPPQPRAEARDKSTQTDDIPQKDASTDTRKCKQRTMVSEVKAKEKPKADEAESDAEMGTCEPVKPKDECDGSTEMPSTESEGERRNSWWRYLYPFYYFV